MDFAWFIQLTIMHLNGRHGRASGTIHFRIALKLKTKGIYHFTKRQWWDGVNVSCLENQTETFSSKHTHRGREKT